MKKFLSKITLPALAFTMALFVSGLLVAFSDSKVLALKSSPLSMIAKAFSTAGNAYWALFRGSIFDPELAKASFIEGFYPLPRPLLPHRH